MADDKPNSFRGGVSVMTKENMDDGGWNEWSRHVLAEIERLSENQAVMNEKLSEFHADIKVLYIKAGLVGLLGGAIPAAVAVILMFLSTGK